MVKTTRLKHHAVSGDGETVDLTFATDQKDVVLTLSAGEAYATAVDLHAAVQLAEDRRQKTVPYERAVSRPKQLLVQALSNNTEVCVTFRMPDRSEHRYALPPKDARDLQTGISIFLSPQTQTIPPTRQ